MSLIGKLKEVLTSKPKYTYVSMLQDTKETGNVYVLTHGELRVVMQAGKVHMFNNKTAPRIVLVALSIPKGHSAYSENVTELLDSLTDFHTVAKPHEVKEFASAVNHMIERGILDVSRNTKKDLEQLRDTILSAAKANGVSDVKLFRKKGEE